MKHGRQRRHRKAVAFYLACFGFRKPFKVLCDGTFVHNLVVHKVDPAEGAVSSTLSAPVKLFTTRCVLEELRRLGRSHSDTLAAAQSLAVARCDHDGKTKAEDCIFDVVKDNNSEHFFVASQDAVLRKKLLEIPGVPAMYGLRNCLFLEQPSSAQREFARESEKNRERISDKERKMLRKRTCQILVSTGSLPPSYEVEDHSDQNRDAAVVEKLKAVEKVLGVKDKPRFKRKKTKGPNPLSCLKKKTKVNQKPTSAKGNETDKDSAKSTGRKRKRSRKSKAPPAEGN